MSLATTTNLRALKYNNKIEKHLILYNKIKNKKKINLKTITKQSIILINSVLRGGL